MFNIISILAMALLTVGLWLISPAIVLFPVCFFILVVIFGILNN